MNVTTVDIEREAGIDPAGAILPPATHARMRLSIIVQRMAIQTVTRSFAVIPDCNVCITIAGGASMAVVPRTPGTTLVPKSAQATTLVASWPSSMQTMVFMSKPSKCVCALNAT
jgi:hypothetical protein